MNFKTLTTDKVQSMYLDRINNFLTDERFAEYYEISLPEAQIILTNGAEIHERYVQMYKSLICLNNLK